MKNLLRIAAAFGLLPPAGLVAVSALRSGKPAAVLYDGSGIILAAAITVTAVAFIGCAAFWWLLTAARRAGCVSTRADIQAAAEAVSLPVTSTSKAA